MKLIAKGWRWSVIPLLLIEFHHTSCELWIGKSPVWTKDWEMRVYPRQATLPRQNYQPVLAWRSVRFPSTPSLTVLSFRHNHDQSDLPSPHIRSKCVGKQHTEIRVHNLFRDESDGEPFFAHTWSHWLTHSQISSTPISVCSSLDWRDEEACSFIEEHCRHEYSAFFSLSVSSVQLHRYLEQNIECFPQLIFSLDFWTPMVNVSRDSIFVSQPLSRSVAL